MEFKVIRAPKQKRAKVKKTKYGRLFIAMKGLNVGDKVIAWTNSPENLTNQRIRNVVRGLNSFKEMLPKRKFEMSTITSSNGQGNDIIIKRTE